MSLALAGELMKIDTPEHLSEKLNVLLIPREHEVVRASLKERMFSNLRPKIITVVLVLVSWLIITARQGGIVTVTAPITFHNLPDGLVFVNSSPEEVEVQVKALSKLIPSPKQLDVVADVDLAKVREGSSRLTIRNDDLHVPLGMVVAGIKPSSVRVIAEKKMRKTLRVRVQTTGVLPEGEVLRKIQVEPATVTVEGPESALVSLETVRTEEVDLSEMRRNSSVEKGLVQPAPQVRLVANAPVRVRLVISGRSARGL